MVSCPRPTLLPPLHAGTWWWERHLPPRPAQTAAWMIFLLCFFSVPLKPALPAELLGCSRAVYCFHQLLGENGSS